MTPQEQEALRLAPLDGCDTDSERKAYARGRLQGLGEMDEAHEEIYEAANGYCIEAAKKAGEKFAKLRQEYQQP